MKYLILTVLVLSFSSLSYACPQEEPICVDQLGDQSVGWIFLTGDRPVVKTVRVIGGAKGLK